MKKKVYPSRQLNILQKININKKLRLGLLNMASLLEKYIKYIFRIKLINFINKSIYLINNVTQN